MGLRNLSYCLIEWNDESVHIRDWCVANVVGEKNAKTMSIEQASIMLLDFLRDRFSEDLGNETVVAIEQQPVGRQVTSNVRMKVLSHVVHTFFYLRGYSVRFVSPKRKLEGLEQSKAKANKERYAHNKRVAVEHCNTVIAGQDPMWADFFVALPKKDDAADSLLQGLVVVEDSRKAKQKEAAKAAKVAERERKRLEKEAAKEARRLAREAKKEQKRKATEEKAAKKAKKQKTGLSCHDVVMSIPVI